MVGRKYCLPILLLLWPRPCGPASCYCTLILDDRLPHGSNSTWCSTRWGGGTVLLFPTWGLLFHCLCRRRRSRRSGLTSRGCKFRPSGFLSSPWRFLMSVLSAMLYASFLERRLAYSTTCFDSVKFAIVRLVAVAQSSSVAFSILTKSVEISMTLLKPPPLL